MGRKGKQELEAQRTKLQNESDLLKLQLRRTEEQLQEAKQKSELDAQKERDRRKLQSDLSQVDDLHKNKLEKLQANFRSQLEQLQRASPNGPERPPDWTQESEACPLVPSPAAPPAPDRLQEEADRGVAWRDLHDREEQRAVAAKAELQRYQTEMSELQAATARELADVAEVRQKLLKRQQTEDKVNEDKLAELRATELKSQKFQQNQDALQREAKELQRQLSEAMYDVGKKDREQQLKEAELSEVRQSIHSIQDEMDQVNRQLQAQCGRVQRVESSLRLSRDLGSKVHSMRDMVMESHTALGQLCGLVEHEKTQRGECSQGLRQQQMRTELLLQLLSHFKSRTQDLAPQVLLNQATEFAQLQTGSVPASPSNPVFSAPAAASNLSAVPPWAERGVAG